jgi:hypothetical protein
MKRQRGRGRKPGGGGGGGGGGGHHPNRTLESNGPDVKIRGSASHIYEKYVQLSRDASSSGDRVMSENYAQHAEHYFRMLRAMAPQMPVYEPRQVGQDLDFEQEGGEDVEGAEDGEYAAAEGQPQGGYNPQQQQRQPYENRGEQRGERGDRGDRGNFGRQGFRQPRPDAQRGEQQPRAGGEPRQDENGEAVFTEPRRYAAEAPEGAPAQAEGAEGGQEERGPRRRGRGRGRYRPEGGRGEGEGEAGPVEGFGDNVPAFVGNE